MGSTTSLPESTIETPEFTDAQRRNAWKQQYFGRHYFGNSRGRDLKTAMDEFQPGYSVATVHDTCKNRVLSECGVEADTIQPTEYYLKFDLKSELDGEGMTIHGRPPVDLVIVLVRNNFSVGLEACLLKTMGRLTSQDRVGVVVADGECIKTLKPLSFIDASHDIGKMSSALTSTPPDGVPDVGEAVMLAFSLLEAREGDVSDDEIMVSEMREVGSETRLGRMMLLMPADDSDAHEFGALVSGEPLCSSLMWRESCDRAMSVIDARSDRCSSALLSIVVLLCHPMSDPALPAAAVSERIHALPGCSCLAGADATELSWRLAEELDYLMCPIAFSITLEIDAPFQIDAVYGRSKLLPLLMHKDKQKVIVAHTLFATPEADGGCTRGRSVLLRLRRAPAAGLGHTPSEEDVLDDTSLQLKLLYTDVHAHAEEETVQLCLPNKRTSISALDRWDSLEWHASDFGECKQDDPDLDAIIGSYASGCSLDECSDRPASSYYEDDSVRKAVLIARYCDVVDAVVSSRSERRLSRALSPMADEPQSPSSGAPYSRSSTPPLDRSELGPPNLFDTTVSSAMDLIDHYTSPLDALLDEFWPDETPPPVELSDSMPEFVEWFERERATVADKHSSFDEEARMLRCLVGGARRQTPAV